MIDEIKVGIANDYLLFSKVVVQAMHPYTNLHVELVAQKK